MFNPKQYLDTVSKKPLWDLVLTYAYADLLTNQLTSDQWFEVLKDLDHKYFPQTETGESATYLHSLLERATPEAMKQAKKSLKGYCEYLIYMDQKAGKISPQMAAQAKVALPDYLTKIRPTMKDH